MRELLANPRLFPSLIILLNLLAFARYVAAFAWGHAVYWLSAAVLTFAVTFLMGSSA